MKSNLNLDELDYKIVEELMQDSSVSFADLGKKLSVAGGTIHGRLKRLEDVGVIQGKSLMVNYKLLGLDVLSIVGIYLEKSSSYDHVVENLKEIPEIVRLIYTTGKYIMFVEIVCKNILDLKTILHDKIQVIKGIERAETFIILEETLRRNISKIPRNK